MVQGILRLMGIMEENSSKRNDEETDCKTEKSNQNPISRAMTEDS